MNKKKLSTSTRTRARVRARTSTRQRANDPARIAKNTVLAVIILAMLTVIAFTLYNLIATPEFLVKREVESITSDYYENYFYNKILENNSINPKESDLSIIEPAMSKALEKYVSNGFARVSFRQLLLYDDRKHAASSNFLSEYCDLDKSIIKIYPESPFGRKNYRVDYSYSCKF